MCSSPNSWTSVKYKDSFLLVWTLVTTHVLLDSMRKLFRRGANFHLYGMICSMVLPIPFAAGYSAKANNNTLHSLNNFVCFSADAIYSKPLHDYLYTAVGLSIWLCSFLLYRQRQWENPITNKRNFLIQVLYLYSSTTITVAKCLYVTSEKQKA